MTRYYSPTDRNEQFATPETDAEGTITEVPPTGATADSDMPEASRAWFTSDPIPDGKQWQNDPTGRFPVLADIPPPTDTELRAAERAWAASELRRTDFAMLPDSRHTGADLDAIRAYRHALRNPQREATTGYPAQSWRPSLSVEVE